MGDFSRSTFDRLKHYVGVRMQQGVPLLDADWNELEDIRRYEVQAFLKWFVGDGVPAGNNGFRIDPAGVVNDLLITGGNGTPDGAGRCLVDGRDAVNETTLAYTAQPLFNNAALAAAWDVPVLGPLSPPGTGTRTDLVFLDVWDREVNAAEDDALVNPLVGMETAVRLRREWTVRVRPGLDTVPQPADTDFRTGHSYLPLARMFRQAGAATILAPALTDLRPRGLLMPPGTFVDDVFGLSAEDYRRGTYRPQVSIREAINALLAGRLPTTRELAVSPNPAADVLGRASVVDANGGLVAIWQRGNAGSEQIVGARLDPARASDFEPALTIASGGRRLNPAAAPLPNGDLLVAYQTGANDGVTTNVEMRRGSLTNLSGVQPQIVAGSDTTAEQEARAVLVGDQVVFFVLIGITKRRWHFKRYHHVQDGFVDANPVPFSAPDLDVRDLHAASAGGVVWVAHGDGTSVQVARFNPVNPSGNQQDPPVIDMQASFAAARTPEVFVLALSGTEALVCYDDGAGISVVAAGNGAWSAPARVPDTVAADIEPAMLRDADGTVHLLHARPAGGSTADIFLRRRTGSGLWTAPQKLVAGAASTPRPFPILVPASGPWAFWSASADIFAKRIITSI